MATNKHYGLLILALLLLLTPFVRAAEIPQTMSDLNTPAPYKVWTSFTSTTSNNPQDCWQVFDGNDGTPVSPSCQIPNAANLGVNNYVAVDLGANYTVKNYTVLGKTVASGLGTATYTVWGSTNNVTWTSLWTNSSSDSWTTKRTYTLPVGNQGVYRYFMIANFTTGSDHIVQTFYLGVDPIVATTPTLTMQVQNLVNGTTLNGFCINATGTNTSFNQCNSTGNALTMNTTGTYNITAYNINGSHYNVTYKNYVFTSTTSVVLSTHQSFINVTAKQLFTNNSINSFSSKNGLILNSTSSGSILLPANTNNNLNVSVTGNYSLNYSVTTTALTVTQFNATGIYDDLFTIGAKSNGAGVQNFTVNVSNSTLGGQLYVFNTTTGNISFPLLQGYTYFFNMNASSYALTNATLPSNSSANLYNFTLLLQNTFELYFYNETSNLPLNASNITVQLISDSYANNYTTNNGTLTVSLLVPGEYTIRYYREASVPRDYYVSLTPQSYQNLTLYLVDSEISNLYIAEVVDQSLRPIGNTTVKLLRYYVGCNCYKVVEMARTDTNGNAVLRVVPNVIPYKLLLTKNSYSVTTDPTKFTSSTNTYTLNVFNNPLASIQGISSVSRSLTFNNATLTYTYTWSDTTNLVSRGCLNVQKNKNGVTTTAINSCSAGSSGSIVYTVTDTNQTQYTATGSVETNTEFSTYYDTLSTNFISSGVVTFGVAGLFLAFIVLLVLIMYGAESGTDSIIIMSIIGMFGLGIIGLISSSWTVMIPIAILGVVVIYKTRT